MRNLLYILLLIFLFSCKKENPISDIPEIEFISISPTIVQEFSDEIIITISYFDANGDLGENNPDVENLFVKDNRNEIEYAFRIPELTPTGNEIAIQGNLDISLSNTGITDGSNSQTTTFNIYMVDRANHQSNIVASTPITIIN